MGNSKRTVEEIAATRERNIRHSNMRRAMRLEEKRYTDRLWKDIQDAYQMTDKQVSAMKCIAEEIKAKHLQAVKDLWTIDKSCEMKVVNGENGPQLEVMKDE